MPTNGQKKYQEYLQSDHWKELRARKHKRASRRNGKLRCAICGSTDKVHTHHLIYRNWYDVVTSDLRMLCDICHSTAHELISAGVIQPNKYTSHHAIFGATKVAVKEARGLGNKNLFKPIRINLSKKADPMVEISTTNDLFQITDQLIESGRSKSGGWNRKQLSVLGIDWPPTKGWKRRIVGKEINCEQAQKFLDLKGQYANP